MTITHKCSAPVGRGYNILQARRALVDDIAKAALVSQLEAYVDMLLDTQPYLTNRATVVAGLENIQDDAARLASDLMYELKKAVLTRIAEQQSTIVVTRIDWNTDGELSDIAVDVTFE